VLFRSLSEHYDLRPALAATRDGIDAFVSDSDWVWLGVLVRLLGTPDDPQSVRASGRFGFAMTPQDPQYEKLHVHRWSPELIPLGNDGGHFGAYHPAFLRDRVLPMLKKSSGSETTANIAH
jgi:hypothetical protein